MDGHSTFRRIAIIPARGGSKRLPKKNVLEFRGKPLIAYTIEAACDAGIFARVIVSTEDHEIAAVANRFGAQISERPEHLAQDEVGVVSVCLDLLEREEGAGHAYDVMCCLYATAPLRTAEDIVQTVGLLEPGVCEFSMAVTDYDTPPHQALRIDATGFLRPMWPELVHRREQEIGQLRVDNGSTYAVFTDAFRKHRTFYGPTLRGHFMPRWRSTDINVADDLSMANFLAEKLGL